MPASETGGTGTFSRGDGIFGNLSGGQRGILLQAPSSFTTARTRTSEPPAARLPTTIRAHHLFRIGLPKLGLYLPGLSDFVFAEGRGRGRIWAGGIETRVAGGLHRVRHHSPAEGCQGLQCVPCLVFLQSGPESADAWFGMLWVRGCPKCAVRSLVRSGVEAWTSATSLAPSHDFPRMRWARVDGRRFRLQRQKREVRVVRASLGTEGPEPWLLTAQSALPACQSHFEVRHWAFSAKEIADVFRAKFPGLVVPPGRQRTQSVHVRTIIIIIIYSALSATCTRRCCSWNSRTWLRVKVG